ncbi:hypothetical protein PR048_005847, partial [Dryococelus australis]
MAKKRPCLPGCVDILSVRNHFPLREKLFRAWLHRIRNPKQEESVRYLFDLHFNDECKNAGSKSIKIDSMPHNFFQ